MAHRRSVFVQYRYVEDWVVLAPTRWKWRMAIRAVNQVMARLRVRQHPDKTIIGRIARGSISWSIDFRQSGWRWGGRRSSGEWHGCPSLMSMVRRIAARNLRAALDAAGMSWAVNHNVEWLIVTDPRVVFVLPPKISQTRCKYKREAVT